MNRNSTKFTAAVLFALVLSVSAVLGQSTDDGKAPLLVGAWEYVGPATVDCETREPNGPDVRVSLLFNQGGTMFVEDTIIFEGPYRTTGPGIWKREANGDFSYAHMHYSFDPENPLNFIGTIKQRSRLRLSKDGNSYTEKGTFEGIAPDGTVIFSGCFEGTTNRVVF